jgi:hypothetical protein
LGPISNREFPPSQPDEFVVGAANSIGGCVNFVNSAVEAFWVFTFCPVVWDRLPVRIICRKRLSRYGRQERLAGPPELLPHRLQFRVEEFMVGAVAVIVEGLDILQAFLRERELKIMVLRNLIDPLLCKVSMKSLRIFLSASACRYGSAVAGVRCFPSATSLYNLARAAFTSRTV